MDGDHFECPITPDNVIRVNLNDYDELVVAASHDSIQMFPDHKYNYLRYWDPQEGKMKAVWLDEEYLSELNDRGIPITIRESITESEHDSYGVYMGQIALEEVIIETVPENMDAEIDYFIGEWLDGS